MNETPNTQSEATRADKPQLTCERCGEKTDAGVWLGFTYVGVECLRSDDKEYLEEPSVLDRHRPWTHNQ